MASPQQQEREEGQQPQEARTGSRRVVLLTLLWLLPPTPLAAYLMALVLGLNRTEVWWAMGLVLPPVLLLWGFAYPSMVIRFLTRRALAEVPGDTAGIRLKRILELPYRIVLFGLYVPWTLGGLSFSLASALWFERSPLRSIPGALVGLCFGVLLGFPIAARLEESLQRTALREHERLPLHTIEGRGPFWPRQAWYLPYAFAASLASAMLLGILVVAVQTLAVERQMVDELEQAGQLVAAEHLKGLTTSLLSKSSLPLLTVGLFLLVVPTITAWILARRQERGSRAVLQAIKDLSAGQLPRLTWVSTDEIGDLSLGMNGVLARLRDLPRELQSSVQQLVEAGQSLSAVNEVQRRNVTLQASAIQEASVTAQEIKQTVTIAAKRAQSTLGVAMRAEELGRSGAKAIEQTLVGFTAVRNSMVSIRDKILHLQQSARQIGEITLTVKDLADQSNMLALNAAIEAVRSGEHGRGFGVVAREIRSLADQSIRATARIRDILAQISSGIREAMTLSDKGVEQVEGGLQEAETSGKSLRELSDIVKDNSAAMRQIIVAVNQQNVGFTQITTAISELNKVMDQTVQGLDSVTVASQALQNISEQVSQLANQYGAG